MQQQEALLSSGAADGMADSASLLLQARHELPPQLQSGQPRTALAGPALMDMAELAEGAAP